MFVIFVVLLSLGMWLAYKQGYFIGSHNVSDERAVQLHNEMMYRISEMLARPEMFGGLEAVEFQFLLMLEIAGRDNDILQDVGEKYRVFVKEKNGNRSIYLNAVEGMTHQKLCALLKEFLQRP